MRRFKQILLGEMIGILLTLHHALIPHLWDTSCGNVYVSMVHLNVGMTVLEICCLLLYALVSVCETIPGMLVYIYVTALLNTSPRACTLGFLGTSRLRLLSASGH